MEFNDGDMIRGSYGNEWVRTNGYWTSKSKLDRKFGDDTAQWLIELRVDTRAPTPVGSKKISKSVPSPTPVYVYSYTLIKG